MFRTRMLASLVIPIVVATTVQTLVAGEPVPTTPPAESIHQWKSDPAAKPTADGTATSPAKSIREWKTKPVATQAANCPATPTASSAATSAVLTTAPKSPVTISLTSTLREGNLVVVLDDVPIFNEKFQKPVLLISQTTTWDPLSVAAGEHRLSAKVYGTKKTYFSATYDLVLSRTKGNALRFVIQGDKLTVELAS